MWKKRRVWIVLAGVIAVAGAVWVLVPYAFVRGIVVGALVMPALLLGGLIFFARRMRGKIEHRFEPPPLPTGTWDHDMTARDLDGNEVDFADFSDRVLILNFWATWCAPCVAEMPSLGRLHRATEDVGVAMACLTAEPPGKVRKFVEKRGIDVPVYMLDGEPPECFRSRAIPATFVVDATGAIVMRHFGAAAWDDDRIVNFVRGLAVAS